MAFKKNPPPTLYIRSGYCIDLLRSTTRQGFTRIERQIRENQYVAHGLKPPSFETVRDYFRLHRSVAFEPRDGSKSPPWLLAAELEYPGTAEAFFHPLADLLFGYLESSFLWRRHFSRIPQQWINEARNRGSTALAGEWEAINLSQEERKHRTPPKDHLDRLSFVHLSMMRLAEPIGSRLFVKPGLSRCWRRAYENSVEDDVAFLLSIGSLDALAALLGLAEEGALIGDMHRYRHAKSALLARIPHIHFLPGCRRIAKALELDITSHLEMHVFPRRYNGTLHMGFGLPVSWRSMAYETLLSNRESRGEDFGKDARHDIDLPPA